MLCPVLKQSWGIMTFFNSSDKDEIEIQLRKRINELEKANQDLHTENMILNQEITKREQAEEALRESEKRFRALVTASSEVLYRMSSDWSEMRQLHSRGFLASTEKPNPTWLQEYIPPEDQTHVIDTINQAIRTKSVFELEHRVWRADGSVGWTFSRAVPLLDDNGEIVEWFGAASDITKRKQAEGALKKAYETLEEKVKERAAELEKAYRSLKESQENLAEAQRIAHIGSWEWDVENDKTHWSEEMYRIFGLKPQESEITYALSLNYVHPEDRDYVDNAVKGAFKGEQYSIDYRIISTDRKERTVHAYGEVTFNDENIPALMRGTVQDITERKKTEEKIQMLANLVESSDDAIITESLDCIITSWNRGAEQVYGYSTEEILGKPISILAPPHLEEETRELIERVKKGERIQQYETLRLRKDGKIINVSITLSPVFDIYGKLTAISLIYRDITERKEAEGALAKIEITRQKEIHHRIKNNLQVISSLLDLQAGKFKDRRCINDSEVLEAFRESHDRVLSIALIHEELHEGEGEDALNFSLYLQRLVENLFQSYRLGDSNISLNMSLEKDIFFGMDVAVPLGMIVNELVSNSLKHAFPGMDEGEIQIKIFENELSDNKENLTEKDTRYTLIVSDNGISIPENLGWEDSDTLGLQLVNLLVDQLDGEIELKRDKGTEFVVRFSAEEEKMNKNQLRSRW